MAKKRQWRWLPALENAVYQAFHVHCKLTLKVLTRRISENLKRFLRDMCQHDPRADSYRPSLRFCRKYLCGSAASERKGTRCLSGGSLSLRTSRWRSAQKIKRWCQRFRGLTREPLRLGEEVFARSEWKPVTPSSGAGSNDLQGCSVTDTKYGRFSPHLRLNNDQVPLEFVNDQVQTWGKTVQIAWKCGELKLYFSPSAGG